MNNGYYNTQAEEKIQMKLSDRLEKVVSFVDPTEKAADIGTDHGYVPVELVRRGIVSGAYAMDVKKGPLSRAEQHIKMAGLENKIELRLSDGLAGLKPGEAEAVIIAGMGGELIIHILEQGKELWDSVEQWILSPHSEIHKVRRWLYENGFPIEKEAMIREEDKFYAVFRAGKRGTGTLEDDGMQEEQWDFRYSRLLMDAKDPIFKEFLKDEEKKLVVLTEKLREQAASSERAGESLKRAEERLMKNREVQNEVQ